MQSFETTIFDENYTLYDKLSDPNKDADGKGTQERFCEVWGAELDTIVPYIENLNYNVLVPSSRASKFVGYYEKALGYKEYWYWFKDAPISFRNNVVRVMKRIYQIRSTILCLEVMFSWLGCTVVVTEDFNYDAGFDSPTTLDSSLRRFDSYTNFQIPVDIAITGPSLGGFPIPLPFTLGGAGSAALFLRAIYTILIFNQPINVIIRSITYNGADISGDIDTINIATEATYGHSLNTSF